MIINVNAPDQIAAAILASLAGVPGVSVTIGGALASPPAPAPRKEPSPPSATVAAPATRRTAAKAPRAIVRYTVTRKGNGTAADVTGKRREVLEYLKKVGPRGLAELQRELPALNSKTIDGSVYALRHSGHIVAKAAK